jgi:7-cyano-7-deazaguanine synthase
MNTTAALSIPLPASSATTAMVMFSGGQDSTVCLAWALTHFSHVETVGFDYGQRHRVELDCRSKVLEKLRQQFPPWQEKLGPDHLLDLTWMGQVSESALTQDRAIEMQANGLPNTFVPGRNLLFFNVAAMLAYRRGANALVGGMCETDYSGYPDCRDNTLKALQVALSLGMDTPMTLHTPLMWLTKAQTWQLSLELGGQILVDTIVRDTHTCYLGDRQHQHPWGFGCGACPACELRQQGFEHFMSSQTSTTG